MIVLSNMARIRQSSCFRWPICKALKIDHACKRFPSTAKTLVPVLAGSLWTTENHGYKRKQALK